MFLRCYRCVSVHRGHSLSYVDVGEDVDDAGLGTRTYICVKVMSKGLD